MTTSPDLDRLRGVYEATHARLWRAVLAWSGSVEVADEAVAEAFAQAARRGSALLDPEAWVWRAAFRIAAGELGRAREDGRRTTTLDREAHDRPTAIAPGLTEDTAELLAALRQLSDQQRRAVVLVDGAGFTAPEAARLLDTSGATVRVQLMRARRRLRTLLTETTPETES